MIVLALDIATATGAAWDGPEGRPAFSSYRAPDYALGMKCKGFVAWLHDLVQVVGPDLVGVEAPLVQGGNKLKTNVDTVRLLITLAGLAHYVAACSGIATTEKNVATVKKHFAGHGRADKDMIMARCRQLGWTPRNNNEGDAAALWTLIKSEREPQWSYKTTPLFGRSPA